MTRPIDADALKDDILKSAVMIDDRGIQTGYEIAIELIKKQPTIDAEPVRHGKWMPREEGKVYPFWERYTCSECGEHSDDKRYCPNCGARMDEE